MSRRRLRTSSALGALTLAAAAACDATPPPVGMERGAELFETCQPCHGAMGQGNPDIAAPAVAGLPQWYIESQLLSFQNGWRGKHAEDLAGLRMRPMAVSLNREGDVASVAQYEQVCLACHGPDGRGNELLRSPPIVQLHDWYLVQELQNFRSGARGTHPNDTWGQTMRVNSVLLSDQAMQDLIAYVQTLR